MTQPPTVRVARREGFNAAHQLCNPALSPEENRRLFGPRTGYVVDLKRLSDIMSERIIRQVDHCNLNTDVPWLVGHIPTAENLAVAFWERLRPELPTGSLRVRVWETEKNWAEYSTER
ncbi:MAG: 6-carboxytetrahydropterin synthase [Actinobacteria bacterium]|nr:MAG: 6-carboxytetrahydropterin synthase [Actinomycetota bacterium]